MLNNASIELVVGIADIKIGKAPQIIKTSLGSCVAVCLYSEKHQVGGILHFMLANSSINTGLGELKKAKYADTGIKELLKQLKMNFNLTNDDLKAKIFGGAKILVNATFQIGEDNIAKAREILKNENIKIVNSKLGGLKGYLINMELSTGKVKCQIFGGLSEEF